MREVIEGWVARDKDDILCLYESCPVRFGDMLWVEKDMELEPSEQNVYILNKDLFPELKWEDEPMRVKITIEAGVNRQPANNTYEPHQISYEDELRIRQEYCDHDWVENHNGFYHDPCFIPMICTKCGAKTEFYQRD